MKKVVSILIITVYTLLTSSQVWAFNQAHINNNSNLSYEEISKMGGLVRCMVDISTYTDFELAPDITISDQDASSLLLRLMGMYYWQSSDFDYNDFNPDIFHDPEYSDRVIAPGLTKAECDSIMISAIGNSYNYIADGGLHFENDLYSVAVSFEDPTDNMRITDITGNGNEYRIHFTRYYAMSEYDYEEGKPEIERSKGVATVIRNDSSIYGFTVTHFTPTITDGPIRVHVNGEEVAFDQPPIIEDGRTLVPARAIIEAMGGIMHWDELNMTAVALFMNKRVEFDIGSNEVNISMFTPPEREIAEIDVAPKILNNRTLIPVRALTESIENADISWNDGERIVSITYTSPETPYDEFLLNSNNYFFDKDKVKKYSRVIPHSENYAEGCWGDNMVISSYFMKDTDNDGTQELVMWLDGGEGLKLFSIWGINDGNVEIKHGLLGAFARGIFHYSFVKSPDGETLLRAVSHVGPSGGVRHDCGLYRINDTFELIKSVSYDFEYDYENKLENGEPSIDYENVTATIDGMNVSLDEAMALSEELLAMPEE